MKEEITNQILNAVKEASIDCTLHSRAGDKSSVQCFTFGSANPEKFSYQPSISTEEQDTVTQVNKVKVTWKAVKLTHEGKKYAFNKENNKVYDLDSYLRGQPIQVAKIEFTKGKKTTYRFIPI